MTWRKIEGGGEVNLVRSRSGAVFEVHRGACRSWKDGEAEARTEREEAPAVGDGVAGDGAGGPLLDVYWSLICSFILFLGLTY